jgi:hypothetical protein
MMNSFSLNRFWNTLCWVLAVNFRTMLMWTAGSAVGVFLFETVYMTMDNGTTYLQSLNSMSSFSTFLVVLAIVIGLSSIFVGFNKKPRREAFLMLPSSDLEKFLASVIFVTIVWPVCVFLAFAVGDTIRMVVGSLVYEESWISCIWQVSERLIPIDMRATTLMPYSMLYITMLNVSFLGFLLWVHSVYILGGTLLRRYSFVVSSLLWMFVAILFIWAVDRYELSFFNTQWENNVLVSFDVGFWGYAVSVVLPLLAVFNYWMSFRIFKGFQLITNKWTNYDILKR